MGLRLNHGVAFKYDNDHIIHFFRFQPQTMIMDVSIWRLPKNIVAPNHPKLDDLNIGENGLGNVPFL